MESQETVSKNTLFEMLYRNTKALTVALGYRAPMTRYHSERIDDLSRMVGLRADIDDNELHLVVAAPWTPVDGQAPGAAIAGAARCVS